MRLDARDLRACLGIAAVVLGVTHQVVLGGRAFFESDIQLFWHSRVSAFRQVVGAGSWPLWNPWVSFGQPLLADANTQVFYPPTWLELVLDPITYHSVFAIAHLLLAGLGTYFLARRLGLSASGAFAAAAVWTTSGPLLSLLYVWNHFLGACWMPWVLLAAVVALSSPRVSLAFLWGGATAVQLFTGSPDMLIYTQILVAFFVLPGLLRRDSPAPSSRRRLATVATAAVFAGGLSAAQWLPSLEVLSRSVRSRLVTDGELLWSIHPVVMLQCALPVFLHELPLRAELREILFGNRVPYLDSTYLGAPAVLLAGAAFTGAQARRRKTLLAVAVLGILLALGSHTPVWGLLARFLPPLAIVRYPAKAVILTAFGCALLAGAGVDAWREPLGRARRRPWALLSAGMIVLSVVGGALAWATGPGAGSLAPAFLFRPDPATGWGEILAPTSHRLAAAAILSAFLAALALGRRRRDAPANRWILLGIAAVAAAELAGAHRSVNPTASREYLAHRPGVADLVGEDGRSRVYVYDYYDMGKGMEYLGRADPFVAARLPEGMTEGEALLLGQRMYLYPPTAGIWGIESSYDMDYVALYPEGLDRLVRFLRTTERTPVHLRLLRLGAVGHVLALHREGFDELLPIATYTGPFPEEILVFRVPGALPRTYVVGGARVGDGRTALELLAADDFDPGGEVILPGGAPVPPPPGFEGTSRIAQFRPDRVLIEAELSDPGYVVLVDSHDPGWRARLDGEEVPVLRANLAFRAVRTPAGRHHIELVYRPGAVTRGLWISCAALALPLVVVRLRSRARSRADS